MNKAEGKCSAAEDEEEEAEAEVEDPVDGEPSLIINLLTRMQSRVYKTSEVLL